MSLPLTRRIARVALLVAAGAAPVVGAAGSASAAELPATTDQGGITALDRANVGDGIDDAAQNVTELAGNAGSKAVKKAVPAAGHALGKSAKTSVPAAQKIGGEVAGTAGDIVGDTAGHATKGGLPTDALGKAAPTGQLPLQSLPLG
ncbi:ATP-binding protein [Streptomyces sp. NPDC017941]|uniref:ATP-binding protein n=1 Tax=unclassified Streptomyces TaxID=2593676 RepID=UPI0037AAE6AA